MDIQFVIDELCDVRSELFGEIEELKIDMMVEVRQAIDYEDVAENVSGTMIDFLAEDDDTIRNIKNRIDSLKSRVKKLDDTIFELRSELGIRPQKKNCFSSKKRW